MRSGGRSERVRRRVADACLALLAAGDVDLGPSDVARVSGVSRATVHRWWPTKALLFGAALEAHTADLDTPTSGAWSDDLDRWCDRLAAFFSDPTEVSLNVVMAGDRHPDFRRAVLDHYQPLFESWRARIDQARTAGEIDADIPTDAVLLALVSPFVVVPLLFGTTIPEPTVRDLSRLIGRATGTGGAHEHATGA
ncbi:MAG: TetR/AcrR family transcriptional regulator C-terminal ligand-binding domain-containing protein [Acidimicrobiales bacterium]|nr:TetR/AcrR family transcriptional regulator C-terminal ligand-binding domain-containing protein [Acidimicrobiales bacterium]MCB9395667.1 TetR/AcrR family transcriptional regulator C-terminal ligand-binding domain-containing protein [Acidimicrobiaceae bacterium]